MSAEGNTFHFRAGTPDGGVFSGQLTAISSDEALMQLRAKGFVPLRLAERPIRERWLDREITLGGKKRLATAECESFCRELALLVGSGVVLADALAIMLPSLKSGSAVRAFAVAMRHGLRLGRSLSEAVEQGGFALPGDFVPVLRAGEQAGSLPASLAMLAETYADANRFARLYVSALAYPALLLVVSLVVLLLIAFFVAPSLAGLFTSMERPVPAAIGALAQIAQFGSANLWVVAAGLSLAIAGIVAASASPMLRRGARRFLLRLPVAGEVMRWSASRQLASTLRLCLASGVPMGTALPSALRSAGYGENERTMRRLIEEVRAGARLSASIHAAGILPAKLVHLIAVGESSGRLVDVLAAIVAEARNRFEQRMALVSALLAPALILVVGSLIGAVIFSVFSALLEINEIAF